MSWEVTLAWVRAICWPLALTLILTWLAVGCAARLPEGREPGPGTYLRTMERGDMGFRREYLLHVPKSYVPGRRAPLVVVLHGAFSTGEATARFSGFNELAERDGFVVLYPEGVGLFGLLQHWNAGFCCAMAQQTGVDDIGFLHEAIGEVSERLDIDPAQVFMVGTSNGGMLAFHYAALHPEQVAAVATMAASVGGRLIFESQDHFVGESPVSLAMASPTLPPSSPAPSPAATEDTPPVSVLMFHGNADETVPFYGGQSVRHASAWFLSADESAHFWVKRNRCEGMPEVSFQCDAKVRRKAWTECAQGSEVVFYELAGWGHYWPNKVPDGDLEAFQGLDAASVIWEFFKRNARKPEQVSAAGHEAARPVEGLARVAADESQSF
ncbi:alpha/beta fold hydrolase [Desulfocurvibacter africanus]|uniref:extracellular catalytic domain type 1 short-chain-length polyhydroxyalkanoate depolymerase n=1 Tax=Desulfocurvibacter africanus TaxID=873 RepID=UPI002FD9201D